MGLSEGLPARSDETLLPDDAVPSGMILEFPAERIGEKPDPADVSEAETFSFASAKAWRDMPMEKKLIVIATMQHDAIRAKQQASMPAAERAPLVESDPVILPFPAEAERPVRDRTHLPVPGQPVILTSLIEAQHRAAMSAAEKADAVVRQQIDAPVPTGKNIGEAMSAPTPEQIQSAMLEINLEQTNTQSPTEMIAVVYDIFEKLACGRAPMTQIDAFLLKGRIIGTLSDQNIIDGTCEDELMQLINDDRAAGTAS